MGVSFKAGDDFYNARSPLTSLLRTSEGKKQRYTMAIIKESNLQISLTSNSFHQLFAKQISSAAVASDLFVVLMSGSL